jgi:Zn-dependent protease with chaperone function
VNGVPGPVDRKSFFTAQRRHARAAWRYAIACALAAVAMAVAASVLVSPFVILFCALMLGLVTLARPIPESVWAIFQPLFASYGQLRSAVEDWRLSPSEVMPSLHSVGVLLIPGVAAVLLLWIGVRALLFHVGTVGALLTLGARPPRADDAEERQLVNVVHEMAIAAGLPPPRVALLDTAIANAAAIGSSPRDATVVVSRRLLDELDRDETQGILGHLIGSVGNGDLRILMTFLSVVQTFGLLMALLDAPMSRRARSTIRRLLGLFVLGWRRPTAAGPLADLVGAMLARRLDPDSIEHTLEPIEAAEDSSARRGRRLLRSLQFVVLLPLILVSLEVKLLLFLFTLLVIGPLTWSTLRRRRYLADATAVQLTRNPDGLANALIALAQSSGDLPAAGWAEPLFVVGSAQSRATGLAFASMRRPRGHSPASAPSARSGDLPVLLFGAQPPLRGRLARLRTLGAHIQSPSNDGPHDPATAKPAEPASADAKPSPIGWFVAVPVVVGLLAGLGVLLFYGAAFVLYLFAVGVIGALLVAAGLYVVALELALKLLSLAG